MDDLVLMKIVHSGSDLDSPIDSQSRRQRIVITT